MLEGNGSTIAGGVLIAGLGEEFEYAGVVDKISHARGVLWHGPSTNPLIGDWFVEFGLIDFGQVAGGGVLLVSAEDIIVVLDIEKCEEVLDHPPGIGYEVFVLNDGVVWVIEVDDGRGALDVSCVVDIVRGAVWHLGSDDISAVADGADEVQVGMLVGEFLIAEAVVGGFFCPDVFVDAGVEGVGGHDLIECCALIAL